MRLHLLGLPNAPLTKDYYLDGFCQYTRRMAKLLSRQGHEVYLYGAGTTDAPCTEFIPCIDEADRRAMLAGGKYQNAIYQADNPLWLLANPRIIAEIGKRKQAGDLILQIGGHSQQPVTAAHPELKDVEYSIGYPGNYARYRIYQSRAWQHHCYGQQSISRVRPFDDVIHGFVDESELLAPRTKLTGKPYVAYVGRLVPLKGITVACDAAQIAGVDLKIVGHGAPSIIAYGEHLGSLDTAGRNEVIAGACAVLTPTQYIEPYNMVAVEAQVMGVPVIAPDQGGFIETVEQNVSGWRCKGLDDYVKAVRKAVDFPLDRARVARRAASMFTIKAAMPQYDAYFKRLATLDDRGWYTV